MKTNNAPINSQACSWAPSYLSIDIPLTTQPLGENGDSNFEVVMHALILYKSHLLDQIKHGSDKMAVHPYSSVQLENLREIGQVDEMLLELQQRLIMADQHRVRPKADQSVPDDTPAPVINQLL